MLRELYSDEYFPCCTTNSRRVELGLGSQSERKGTRKDGWTAERKGTGRKGQVRGREQERRVRRR